MESAFGVDHGDIEKSYSPGKLRGLRIANWEGAPKRFPRTAAYAGSKLGGKQWGQEKAKLLAQGKTSNPTGHYMSGETHGRFGRDSLEVLNTKKPTRKLP